ncbi:MAG: EAL domain-containing protein [Natronospirillum sp.]
MAIGKSIASRLAIIAVFIALPVSILFGLNQIHTDYRTEAERIDVLVNQLLTAYLPAADRAIHNIDRRLATEVTAGLLTYDFLVRAEIIDEQGVVLGQAERPLATDSSWLLHEFIPRSIVADRAIPIVGTDNTGLLRIEADRHLALAPVLNRGGEILLTALLQAGVFMVLFYMAYHWQVTRPLVALSQQFHRFDPEHSDTTALKVSTSHRHDELGELAASARRLVYAVQSLLQERAEAEQAIRLSSERIEYLAYHDGLTDLPNRTLIHDRLETIVANAHRSGKISALVFVDLDNFKNINDSLGHEAGDHVLKEVARRLLRQVSTADMVARMGGDEFVMCLTDIADSRKDALLIAETRAVFLRQALTIPFWHNQQQLTITASIGIALVPEGSLESSDLLRNADIAMFAAKLQGKNTYQLFQSHMTEEATQRMALETDLRIALQEKQFFVVYQPQVDLRTGEVVGAEALIRWQHPERGVVSPMAFILALETTGLIGPVGQWVMCEACRAVRQWQEAGLWRSGMRMGINVSASRFSDSNLINNVRAAIDDAGIEPQQIDLEITETMLIESIEDTIVRMKQIRALGVTFSIDDFGTGYSSLSYLKRLPVDVIKVDQNFIRDVNSDPNDAAIVDTILDIAKHLGLKTIAEGVETVEQLEFLQARGCTRYQGFLFSKPITNEKMSKLLTKHCRKQA